MVFQDDFFENLPEDLDKALQEICKAFFHFQNSVYDASNLQYYDEYVDGFAGLETFIIVNNLSADFHIPILTESKRTNMELINIFFVEVNTKSEKQISEFKLEEARYKYKTHLNAIFTYKFSEGDVTNIQKLINELRGLIADSEQFEEGHKGRLLKRLEHLQSELHKKMSNLDKFWGLIGDAGIVIGKFGADSKPFVDRIKEIAEIVWRAQASAEELPSGTSMPILNK